MMYQLLIESAKSRARCAYALACFACLHAWRVCMLPCLRAPVLDVLGVLPCLTCLVAWRALSAYVLAMMKCFTFLHVFVLSVLSIGILTFLSNYLFRLHKSRLCN